MCFERDMFARAFLSVIYNAIFSPDKIYPLDSD
jgi:hypothetical protein